MVSLRVNRLKAGSRPTGEMRRFSRSPGDSASATENPRALHMALVSAAVNSMLHIRAAILAVSISIRHLSQYDRQGLSLPFFSR